MEPITSSVDPAPLLTQTAGAGKSDRAARCHLLWKLALAAGSLARELRLASYRRGPEPAAHRDEWERVSRIAKDARVAAKSLEVDGL